ncbi:MAG TPA: alanine--glyoxylate aminotransferase family protein [Gammaproteobacteria bacterium]|jgi:alanine-glyoxylate transaminase/serine-glyoxylate transaminase/serine-pyruvate transaminase|nr:alanine--glyoxylate aminotransferase family protein [Gammaproteobacteria bacterium]
MNINSFVPQERLLHGPGPSGVHPRTLQAMARPTIGHLDPEFVGFMEDVKEMLQAILHTKNRLTFPVSGPGSVGMETCFVNLIEPDDRAVVCVNGVFGQRMVENVKRAGGIPLVLECKWGEAVQPEKLHEFLKEQNRHGRVKAAAFVHAETSTGALSDAAALCEIIRSSDALVIMDAVTSVGGVPVKMDEWGVDALYSGTQKCLSCPPGLSPVSFSDRALNKILNRKSPVQSWFMDLSLVQKYWDVQGQARTYHHTAPINLLYALHEALVLFFQEGEAAVFKRHQEVAAELKTGLLDLGFSYLVHETAQMPQLHVVIPPAQILPQEAKVRAALLQNEYIEIGGGLGELAGKVWRIGLMGHSARRENVAKILQSLRKIIHA